MQENLTLRSQSDHEEDERIKHESKSVLLPSQPPNPMMANGELSNQGKLSEFEHNALLRTDFRAHLRSHKHCR